MLETCVNRHGDYTCEEVSEARNEVLNSTAYSRGDYEGSRDYEVVLAKVVSEFSKIYPSHTNTILYRKYRKVFVWYSCVKCWEYYMSMIFRRQSVSLYPYPHTQRPGGGKRGKCPEGFRYNRRRRTCVGRINCHKDCIAWCSNESTVHFI